VDAVARVAEDHLQPPHDLRLIVDDEHPGLGDVHAIACGCGTRGNETANAVPRPLSAWRLSWPPFASTKPRQIASPRPAPCCPDWRPRKKGSNTCARGDGGIPGPLSVMRTITRSPAAPPLTVTGSPGGEKRTAFSSRLVNTRSS